MNTSSLKLKRYPPTTNRSLQAWNAADEYIFQMAHDAGVDGKNILIFNDSFGYLSCNLLASKPAVVLETKSQHIAIHRNLEINNLKEQQLRFFSLFDELPSEIDLILISIPKSLELFRHYLMLANRYLKDDGVIFCGFMTKHFTPQLLSVASDYFDEVNQSMASKKARIITLQKKKTVEPENPINIIESDFGPFKQYPGVFSGNHIDYATQFLLQQIQIKPEENVIADIGCGNGVIAAFIKQKHPEVTLHLVDDSKAAIESAKLNLPYEKVHFHWNDTLDDIPPDTLDLAVSNPPFHFGHENTIEVSLYLFREIKQRLKSGGRFLCVANQHLNYKTHLDKLFSSVQILAENEKYVVYQAIA